MKFAQRLIDKGFISYADLQKQSDYLIDLYHSFMKFYKCWIPFDEFIDMPIPLTFKLLDRINKDNEKVNPMPVVILGFAKKGFKRGGLSGR